MRVANLPLLDFSSALTTDISIVQMVAGNGSVGTSFEDIWVNGGDYNFLTAASTLEIVSSSANDTAAGVGARSIVLDGLNASGNVISETVATNGGTTAATTNSFLRLNTATLGAVGTYGGSNYNTITIRESGGGAVIGFIGGLGTVNTADYGFGRTKLGMYAIPSTHTAYIRGFEVSTDSSKELTLSLYFRRNLTTTSGSVGPRESLWSSETITETATIDFKHYVTVPSGSDLWFRGKVNTGTMGVDISMSIVLVRN